MNPLVRRMQRFRDIIHEHVPSASVVQVSFLDDRQHRFRVRVQFVDTLAAPNYEHHGRLGIRHLDNQEFEHAARIVAEEIRTTLEGLL